MLKKGSKGSLQVGNPSGVLRFFTGVCAWGTGEGEKNVYYIPYLNYPW